MKSFLKYWLPVLIWLLLIFIGSTDLMSAEQMSRIIGPLLRWFKPDISPEVIAQVQFFARKGAHVTEYTILAALLWRALHWGADLQIKMSILMGAILVACAIFAASDEFHQSFVATRTASESDVLIDICGAIVGLTICFVSARRRKEWA